VIGLTTAIRAAEARLGAERVEGALVVHNDGHGGEGVMHSWGCADEAVGLLTA
jgi:D-amino-acid oxidase